MRPAVRKHPARWIAALTMACALVSAWPAAAEGADYHIEREAVSSQPRRSCTEFTKWMNVLHVDGLPAGVQTDFSAHCRSASKSEQPDYGFDPSTVKVQWLDETNLLYVSWSGFSFYGSGRYRFEGHVVVRVLNGQVSELLRTTFQAYGRAGVCGEGSTTFNVERDQRSGELSFVQVDSVDTPTTAKGGGCEQDQVKKEWRYKLTGEGLVYAGGRSWWEICDRSLAPKVIATERHLSLAQLHRLNPDLKKERLWTGWILIGDHLPPYKPDHDSVADGF